VESLAAALKGVETKGRRGFNAGEIAQYWAIVAFAQRHAVTARRVARRVARPRGAPPACRRRPPERHVARPRARRDVPLSTKVLPMPGKLMRGGWKVVW